MEFLHNFLSGMNTVLTVGNIWINNRLSDLYDQVSENEALSSVFMKLFDVYVTTHMHVSSGCQYAYTNFPIVRIAVDHLVYYSACFTGFIEGYKVEPIQSNWVSTHILIRNNHLFKGNKYIHIENYQMMTTDLNPDCSYNGKIENGVMYFYNILQSLISSLMHVVDAIVVMKDGDRYIIRSILNKHTEFHHKASKSVFLSVAYKHPDIENPIAIEIPESMYQVGNVLLTPMFVKRYLEYQSLSYVFDEKYTLDIIDNDMNMLTMNSKQFGILTEEGWNIVDITKETSDIVESKEIQTEELKSESKGESDEQPNAEPKKESEEEPKEDENE